MLRLHFAAFVFLALAASSCVRTAFAPIWFGPTPNQTYAIKEKNDLLASASYMDADHGTGFSTHAAYSPKKHLMVGGGLSHLSNKGLIYTNETLKATTNQWQGEVYGGSYWNLKSGFLSLQAIGGLGHSFARSKINGSRALDLSYQKLFLQPAVMIKLPNSMYLDFSYRFSQVYFTRVTLVLSSLTSEYVSAISNIQRESPFRMGELGVGYTYQVGPMQTHIQYSIISPYQTTGLEQFDTQLISTSLKFNITELRRMAKKNRAEIPE